jgi:hypothetical protein
MWSDHSVAVQAVLWLVLKRMGRVGSAGRLPPPSHSCNQPQPAGEHSSSSSSTAVSSGGSSSSHGDGAAEASTGTEKAGLEMAYREVPPSPGGGILGAGATGEVLAGR